MWFKEGREPDATGESLMAPAILIDHFTKVL